MEFILAISSKKEAVPEVKAPPNTNDFDKEKIAVEFAKVWAEQSKMLWSRLQTVTAIQTGVFAAWYIVRDKYLHLAPGIPLLGIFLTVLVGLLMRRDSKYLKEFRLKMGIEAEKPKFKLYGTNIGYIILSILLLSDTALLLRSALAALEFHKIIDLPWI